MVQPRSRLTPLQVELLEAFFQHEDRFYLTGGGALAGYHLGHRETHDLDLFALSPIMDDGVGLSDRRLEMSEPRGGRCERLPSSGESSFREKTTQSSSIS